MEAEKRMRREIANSNERRRMQSINAGFQSLRTLLPRHEGEKLSKAAILQQTAEYIYCLEQEKTRLLSQNSQLKRLLSQHDGGGGGTFEPVKRRKVEETGVEESQVESTIIADTVGDVDAEIDDLRAQLDRERRFRMSLEEQVRSYETQPYVERACMLHQDDDELGEMVAMIPEDAIDEEMHLISIDLPPSRPRSPSPPVKVEPKAELAAVVVVAATAAAAESLPSSPGDASRLFPSNTSRQNLETIVEAIRHLEGDHLFAEEQPHHDQDAPLALTNKPPRRRPPPPPPEDFPQFHPQLRPGVIVVKPS